MTSLVSPKWRASLFVSANPPSQIRHSVSSAGYQTILIAARASTQIRSAKKTFFGGLSLSLDAARAESSGHCWVR